MNKSILIVIMFLSANLCQASSGLKRYDFTDRLSNCQKIEDMSGDDGYKIGVSHYGSLGHNTFSSFISECFGTGTEFNSFNMSGLDSDTSCNSEIISEDGCDYLTYVSVSNNSIVAKNINNTHSGFSIFTCSNSGSWIQEKSFCEERNSTNCKAQEISWKGSLEGCFANIPEMPNNSSKKINNLNKEFYGNANAYCKDGNISLDGKTCNFGCKNKIGEVFKWTVDGNTCSSVVKNGDFQGQYKATARNGKKQTVIVDSGNIDAQMEFLKGEVNLKCSDGNWSIEGTDYSCSKLSRSSQLLSCLTKDVKFKYADSSEVVQYKTITCDWE